MQKVGTNAATLEETQLKLQDNQHILNGYREDLEKYQGQASKMTAGARVIMGVGGALIVAAALAKGYQLYQYYNKTFTQIPNFIVDEADIVSYDTDEGAFSRDVASTFDGGTAAIAGGIGLLVGIIGTAIVMKKKRKEEEAA